MDSPPQPIFPFTVLGVPRMVRPPPFAAMPTYEYVCTKCEKSFEAFQSMKDKALTKCPDKACKGRVKRLLGTGAGLIFKGSGFYITDYRSEGYKSAAKSDSAAASSAATPSTPAPVTEGGSSTKSESKPAAKPAAETKAPTKTKKGGG